MNDVETYNTQNGSTANILAIIPEEEFRAVLDDTIADPDFARHVAFLTRATAQRTLSMLHRMKREEGDSQDLARAIGIAHSAIGMLSSSPDRWKAFAHRLAEALVDADMGDVLDDIHSPFPDLSAGAWYDRRVEKAEERERQREANS